MRGILAIEYLYHKIVAGTKTQTRRSGGLEHINVVLDFLGETSHPNDWELAGYRFNDGIQYAGFINHRTGEEKECRARYKLSEVLFLKEPTKVVNGEIVYAYDHPKGTYDSGYLSDFRGLGYSNKLFMGKDQQPRAFIQITGIKCERLLDISDEDCIADGCGTGGNFVNNEYVPFGYIDYLMRPEAGSGYDFCDNTPQQSFISLYKLANKIAKYGSNAPTHGLPRAIDVDNIWVWAYTFEYLKDFKL